MATDFTNYNLVEIALERLSGASFENFANAYFSGILGTEFRPLGGTKDGGADAFQSSAIWEDVDPTGIFYQASIEPNYGSKISKTVSRLREVGRKPKRVVYFTPNVVQHLDQDEIALSEKLGCTIRIYDKRYIVSHVNENASTIAAYYTFLEPTLGYLGHVGGSQLIKPSELETTPAVYVFLRQEIDRHRGGNSLVNAVTDGLILWALEGTDPEQGIFMTEPGILRRIEAHLPTAIPIIKPAISERLSRLSKGGKDQAVRKYAREEKYCLSYSFRERLKTDNAVDESLRIRVQEAFAKRIASFDLLSADEIEKAACLSLDVIQKTFENQGLEFATFITEGEYRHSKLTIADYYDECAKDVEIKAARGLIVKEAVLENLRNAFYNSSESERLYFSRLSSTYTLLFCLKSEPRIVEYFQQMAGDFYLYVGSDIIIRALTERYLRSEDQITRNTFKLITAGGGKLVLSDPVLDEVYHHIRTTDQIFRDHYRSVERNITIDIARQSERILIRCYFYAKLQPLESIDPPRNWHDFISQLCDYSDLYSVQGKDQLRKYLMAEFSMKFEDSQELEAFTQRNQVEELADKLQEYKKGHKLAENDALLTLAVYGRRRQRDEISKVSEYGYRTWWLTQESRILEFTRDLVSKHASEYIMRPEFIVSFFSLAPSMADVRRTYENVFPTILGIRIARRVSQEALSEVLHLLDEANELEKGRMTAKVSDLSDKLKTSALRDTLPSIAAGRPKNS